eukprot:1159113-Pelagomonas_calceolata.AAC.11
MNCSNASGECRGPVPGICWEVQGGAGGTGSTQRQPQPLHLLPRFVTLASSFQNRNIHLVEVKHCEDTRPKIQLKVSKQQQRNLPESAATFQGPQLKLPSIPFCLVWAG